MFQVVYALDPPIEIWNTLNRELMYIAGVRAMDSLVWWCCPPQGFLRIFSEIIYIRTVGNFTLLKIYTLPNHTITIAVYYWDSHMVVIMYGCGTSITILSMWSQWIHQSEHGARWVIKLLSDFSWYLATTGFCYQGHVASLSSNCVGRLFIEGTRMTEFYV
jgi:hypothetical protein